MTGSSDYSCGALRLVGTVNRSLHMAYGLFMGGLAKQILCLECTRNKRNPQDLCASIMINIEPH